MTASNTHTRRLISALCAAVLLGVGMTLHAQSAMDHVAMDSPEMTAAEMTREDVLARVAALAPGERVDFSKRRLSGLDLNGVNLAGADLRWARLNRTDLRGANLRGANLDLAWLIEANLEGADLSGANLFSTQMRGAKLINATLLGARIVADLTNADASGARFDNADMAADMRNQSMGLMRTVLRSASVDGASFRGAKLGRVDAEFASLRGADLRDADFSKAKLAGADLTGARVSGMIISGADVNSARLLDLSGVDAMVGLDRAENLDQALR